MPSFTPLFQCILGSFLVSQDTHIFLELPFSGVSVLLFGVTTVQMASAELLAVNAACCYTLSSEC